MTIILDDVHEKKGLLHTIQDTSNYIKSNIQLLFSKLTDFDFSQLLLLSSNPDYQDALIATLKDNIAYLAGRINSCTPDNASSLSDLISNNPSLADIILANDFEEFYTSINVKEFGFEGIMSAHFQKTEPIGSNMDPEQKQKLSDRIEAIKNLVTEKKVKPDDILWMTQFLAEHGEVSFADENSNYLIKETSQPISTLQLLKENGVETSGLKSIIDNNPSAVIKEMFSKVQGLDFEKSKNSVEIVSMMINEVLKSKNLHYSDIEHIGQGGYSQAFKIGDKVVKVGLHQGQYNIPRNSKRFLQPIARYNFDIVRNDSQSKLAFEVNELCGTREDISKDDLYRVYRDIRMKGMIWTDCKSSNIGVLKKPNIVHHPSFKGEKRAHHSSVGFSEGNEVDILPAGELVVIDLDYIFDENDPAVANYKQNPTINEFERRYREDVAKIRAAIRAKSMEDPTKKHKDKPEDPDR